MYRQQLHEAHESGSSLPKIRTFGKAPNSTNPVQRDFEAASAGPADLTSVDFRVRRRQ